MTNKSKQRAGRGMRVAGGIGFAVLVAMAVYLVHELRRVPDYPPDGERHTDVVAEPFAVARPRSVPAPGEEGSPQSHAPLGAYVEPNNVLGVPPGRQLSPHKIVLPKDLPNPSQPKYLTKMLAEPPAHPVPPDPFHPPPIRVNPDPSAGPAY